MTGPIPAPWAPHLQSVLRIVAALLFIAHGTQKLFAFPIAGPRESVTRMAALVMEFPLEDDVQQPLVYRP